MAPDVLDRLRAADPARRMPEQEPAERERLRRAILATLPTPPKPRPTRRWRPGGRALVVLLGGAILLASGTVYAARLVVGSHGGTIAFTGVNARDHSQEIYLVHADGTGLRRLTDLPGRPGKPAWSPDGSKIAFLLAGAPGARDGVWVVNADGSGQRQVDPSGYGRTGGVTGVDWSPDGKRMVLTIDNGLAVMNADGSGFRRLISDHEGEYNYPVWAPDGRIFFTRSEGVEHATISSVNADGSGLTEVTVGGDFSLSQDGRWLALFDGREGHAVYMAADGRGRESVILEATRSGIASSWSPDGKRIAFASNGAMFGSASALQIVNIDGSGLKQVPNTGLVKDPAWQPR